MIRMKKNDIKRWGLFVLPAGIMMGTVVLIFILLFRSYSTTILNAQKDQLMKIAESVANGMDVYLSEFQDIAEEIPDTSQFLEAETACERGDSSQMDTYLNEVIQAHQGEITHVDFYLTDVGYMGQAGDDHTYTIFKVLGRDDVFERLTINRDEDGNFYFGFGAGSEKGNWVTMYVDMQMVGERTSTYLNMGENGYVMIKDSNGIILMHRVKNQLGINVLTDRMLRYPDFDFDELEVLISHQLAGEKNVETYISYWWGDENPRRTKKVSAYLPLYLGNDFLVVSAVIDYSEVAGDIQTAGIKIMCISIAVLGLGIILLIVLWNYVSQTKITEQENRDLKQKNLDLEKRRKEEERQAHQQRLELIGTMASGIAHEFNNLLTPILGYSQLMLTTMDEQDENYEDVKEIAETAEKAKEIISQINQFSSKNAEQMMQPIHVAEAVHKAMIITDAVKRRNITLVTEISRSRDICIGNPLQIQQMVVNLCNNAIQAIGMDHGTVTVRGEAILPTEKTNPFFEGRKDQWFYQITVEDTGCGMDEETLNQIFVPFFTTKRPGEGTGLGLAVVFRMVEAHHGLICANSTPGVGTNFHIYLPLIEEPEEKIDPFHEIEDKIDPSRGDDEKKESHPEIEEKSDSSRDGGEKKESHPEIGEKNDQTEGI